jgi:hypothetical protein
MKFSLDQIHDLEAVVCESLGWSKNPEALVRANRVVMAMETAMTLQGHTLSGEFPPPSALVDELISPEVQRAYQLVKAELSAKRTAYSKFVVLEGLEEGNRFFSHVGPVGDDPTLCKGEVAYKILGYADSVPQAQTFLYGRPYPL